MRGTRIENEVENLCYKHSQRNQMHEHQCIEKNGKMCEDM
jgi:hypothetical protein